MSDSRRLRHPLLEHVDHGFGLRGFAPTGTPRRPRQVHGVAVATAQQCAADPAPEADAVISEEPEVRVAVVTADCVPILLADARGRAVAAVHAGWRGLSAGVIEACLRALRARGAAPDRLSAAIGPHVGPCCYEVDRPVLDAFAERFSRALPSASTVTRAGHARLDLGLLALDALRAGGLARARIGRFEGVCTACDAERFDSYRRDGAAAGRLVHFIAAAPHRA